MTPRQANGNRKFAKEFGYKTYTGRPCGKFPSHGGKRYTNSANCVRCEGLKHKRKKVQQGEPVVQRHPVVEPYTPEQEARLQSGALKFYGKPCVKGHDGLRYARNGLCIDCAAERNAANRPPAGLTKAERAKWKRAHRAEREAEMVRQILGGDDFDSLLR